MIMLVSAISVSVSAFEPNPSNNNEHIYVGWFGQEIDEVCEFCFTYIYCNPGAISTAPKYSYLTIGINPEFKEKYSDRVRIFRRHDDRG